MDPPLAGGVVGIVELNAPVEAQNGEFDVETHSETRVESQLPVEAIGIEDRRIGVLGRIGFQFPDVAQVEESRAVHDAPDRKAQFEVGLQLHVRQTHGILRQLARLRSGTQRAGRPAAHAVAAARIEETVGRHVGGVAVGDDDAAVDAPHERHALVEHDLAADAQIGTHVLRVAQSENTVVVLARSGFREEVFESVDQVARRLQIEAYERGVAPEVARLVVVGVAEGQTGDELRREAGLEVLVLAVAQEIVVEVSHVDDVDVDGSQRERRVAVVGPQVGQAEARKRAPVVGTVLEVDRELDLGFRLIRRAERARAER